MTPNSYPLPGLRDLGLNGEVPPTLLRRTKWLLMKGGRGPRRQVPTLDGTFGGGEGGEDVNRRFFFLLSILSLGSPKLPRAPPWPPAVIRAVGFQGRVGGGWRGGGVERWRSVGRDRQG